MLNAIKWFTIIIYTGVGMRMMMPPCVRRPSLSTAIDAARRDVAMVTIPVANATARDDDDALAFLLATTMIERHAIGIITVAANGMTTAQKVDASIFHSLLAFEKGGEKSSIIDAARVLWS